MQQNKLPNLKHQSVPTQKYSLPTHMQDQKMQCLLSFTQSIKKKHYNLSHSSKADLSLVDHRTLSDVFCWLVTNPYVT